MSKVILLHGDEQKVVAPPVVQTSQPNKAENFATVWGALSDSASSVLTAIGASKRGAMPVATNQNQIPVTGNANQSYILIGGAIVGGLVLAKLLK